MKRPFLEEHNKFGSSKENSLRNTTHLALGKTIP
jgi:hypothetical protein